MLGLEMLDVVIGMIFVYLLLSLICSAVNEMIELKLKNRASNLEKGIRELLNEPVTKGTPNAGNQNGNDLVRQLYNHPLIFGLFKGDYQPKSKDLPSYIPTRNFALALMDMVSNGSPSMHSGARGATAVATSAIVAADQYQSFRGAIGEIQNKTLARALMTLVDAAGNDMSGARKNIENWFDSSMDRVSGWYKRRAQKIILFLGLGITVFVNADTITIVNSLVQDQASRNSLVAAAQEYAKSQPQDAPGDALNRVERNTERIRTLGLPVGWNRSDPRTWPGRDVGGWLLKIVGWVLTAMAITLGAPFWFDLLNKFMVIRSTVKPHEKSREEASEDRQLSATEQSASRPAVIFGDGGQGTAARDLVVAASGAFQPHEWAVGDAQEGIV